MTTSFNLNPELTMDTNIPAEMRLTATDNAVLRYNVHLSTEFRRKLKKYFRLFAKSNVFVEQVNNTHAFKDFIEIAGQQYEIAYRDCGFAQLEEAEKPIDLLLSIRGTHANNVRICLVTPLTRDMLSRIDNWRDINWLMPGASASNEFAELDMEDGRPSMVGK
jgi:hypothetical protein